MGKLAHIGRWAAGLLIAAFVVIHLSSLLIQNTLQLARPGTAPRVAQLTHNVLTASGTHQRWDMFSPNVGTVSYTPIVVIAMKDGRRIALRSSVEPEFVNWDRSRLLLDTEAADVRAYRPMFHVGDGRMRKYESRAATDEPHWWRIRTSYARWRAIKWLEQNPAARPDVERIELWNAVVKHPGYGEPMHQQSSRMVTLLPMHDPLWPVPVDPMFPFYRP